MLDVANKKRGRPKGKAKGRTPAYILYARIDPALGAALETYVDSTRPHSTRTAILEVAIEEYLVKQGAWPPTNPP